MSSTTTTEDAPFILHEMPMSGNCYKVRLTASLLGINFSKTCQYNTLKGETRTPSYLSQVSATGRIPVLQIGTSTFLPESNAACYYLADLPTSRKQLIPQDRLEHARMLQWMFWEQYSHEPYIAVLRYWRTFVGEENLSDMQRVQIPEKERQAREALDVMEAWLTAEEGRKWFAGGQGVSLADVVLFAYTHRLHEARMDLGGWPGVEKWVERVRGLEGFVSMEEVAA